MGEHDVSGQLDEHQLRAFSKALLDDVHALDRMLANPDMFESGVRRVGAEQEMFLVDEHMRPAPVSTEVLARAGDDRLTTELAKFNLEANLAPHVFGGRCLRGLEMELEEVLSVTRAAAEACGARVMLAGILPTLRRSDLGLDNMSPKPRYLALNRAMTELRGGDFHVLVKGVDELEIHHDNVMLESCTTSFQVHFQVAPDEFARLYNLAQAVAAPVLAVAVNSPVLLGQRLWKETRIALFQRSVDSRSKAHQERGHRPRVSFGDAWVRESVLEIFREDIARFRILLATGMDEDPLGELDRGEVPRLSALRLHNGTVYRWNRACYGVADGKAHLRIENRVLPAGPTVIDEIANAAFFFGLMAALADEYGDIDKVMDFDDAKNNFFAAARTGLKAQFTWVGGRTVTAAGLIVDELLPMARAGLEQAGIDSVDVDRYLGVIEDRVSSGGTGAQWMLESLAGMAGEATPDIRERTLTASILEQQRAGAPVHTWSLSVLQPGGED
jgi:gamma-glutamyl:cysteine ligase YbdK (ATP-grasp superfamily)